MSPSVPVAPAETRRIAFQYRPPLDGLRAVAALLVVFFHAGVPWLSDGYVGVDVFFVLSGFLITSLLVREIVGTDASIRSRSTLDALGGYSPLRCW